MSLEMRLQKLEKLLNSREDDSRTIIVIYPPLKRAEIERGVKRKTGAHNERKARLKKKASFRLVG